MPSGTVLGSELRWLAVACAGDGAEIVVVVIGCLRRGRHRCLTLECESGAKAGRAASCSDHTDLRSV
jgi:hypothetical protein